MDYTTNPHSINIDNSNSYNVTTLTSSHNIIYVNKVIADENPGNYAVALATGFTEKPSGCA